MNDEKRLPSVLDIDVWFQRRLRRPLGRQAVIRLADDYFRETYNTPDAQYSIAERSSIGGRAVNALNSMIFHAYAVRRFRKEVTIIEPSKYDADLDAYVRRRRDEAVAATYERIPLAVDRKYVRSK